MDALIILFIIAIVGYFFFIAKKSSHRPTNQEIGEQGENTVSEILNSDPNTIVFNDILLFDYMTNKSSQIDHIALRPNGVFIIETKNFAGRVYGNDNQLKWTQVLAHGRTKNRFYNPVKQNSTHVYFLSKILKQHNIYVSIIMFPKADLYIRSSTITCNSRKSLLQALDSYTGISLTYQQIENISNQLKKIKENPQITKEEHVLSIHSMQNEILNNICPRCGKKLVLRNGKISQFYGCTGYPKCVFTKKN